MNIRELAERDLKDVKRNLERAKSKQNVPRSEIEHLEELYILRAKILERCKGRKKSVVINSEDSAFKYIESVLNNWGSWRTHHIYLVQALEMLLKLHQSKERTQSEHR